MRATRVRTVGILLDRNKSVQFINFEILISIVMAVILKKQSSKSIKQQIDELLNEHKAVRKKRKWDSFFGKVNYTANPVSYQRNLRDE